MQMTPEQVEDCVNRIAWGKKYITAEDSVGREHTLIVGALSLRFKNFVDFKYKQAIKRAIDAGIHTEAETIKELADKGVWTSEDDDRVKYLKDELEKIESQEDDVGASKRAKFRIKKLKQSIKNHIEEMVSKKSELLMHTAERVAHEEKIRAYVYAILENENETKYWDTWEDFQSCNDSTLVESVTRQIARLDGEDPVKIRYVARNSVWRYKWSCNKSIVNIFGKTTTELTEDQSALIYWSQLYDSVYEAYERPSQDIIDDDDLLDEWLKSQSEKAERDANKRSIGDSSSGGVSSRVMQHGEVFMATSENMINTAEGRGWGGGNKNPRGVTPEQVNELNTPLARKFKNIQEKRIKQAGVIEERDLRHDSDSRRVIGSSDAVVSRKRRRDGFTGKSIDKLLPGGTLKGHKG
jgi:hypothetical protein